VGRGVVGHPQRDDARLQHFGAPSGLDL
jgi:hypothetical protein